MAIYSLRRLRHPNATLDKRWYGFIYKVKQCSKNALVLVRADPPQRDVLPPKQLILLPAKVPSFPVLAALPAFPALRSGTAKLES